jgi:hypothetical protein
LDGDGIGRGVDLRLLGREARQRRGILHGGDGVGVLDLEVGALSPRVEHLVDP